MRPPGRKRRVRPCRRRPATNTPPISSSWIVRKVNLANRWLWQPANPIWHKARARIARGGSVPYKRLARGFPCNSGELWWGGFGRIAEAMWPSHSPKGRNWRGKLNALEQPEWWGRRTTWGRRTMGSRALRWRPAPSARSRRDPQTQPGQAETGDARRLRSARIAGISDRRGRGGGTGLLFLYL